MSVTQVMQIVHQHGNDRFDWLIYGHQNFSREAISILSGKHKIFRHFYRIRDGDVAGRPPPHHRQFLNNETDPNKLYIIGKEIYRRVRFILDIDKIF